MERYRRGHNENDSKSCGLFLCRTPEIPVALGKFAFPPFPMLDDFHTFSTLCNRSVFRSFVPPNFIRSGIEEVITRTTRNRVDFFSAELRKSPWLLGNSRFRLSRCLMISTLFLHFATDRFSGRLYPLISYGAVSKRS